LDLKNQKQKTMFMQRLASQWSFSKTIGLGLLIVSFGLLALPSQGRAEQVYPYTQTFKISAYYSPCEGQSRYATGSYDGDIRLNGRGTNGADGTEVYPGMIAAPKTYAFGTKMSIPGVGVVAVHDRGGAIVPAGERGQDYDRLDLWMGWCDEGLDRALSWGLKTLDVTVYGVDASIEEQVYLEEFTYVESIVKNVVLSPQLFANDIWYLSSGDDVTELQEYLQDLGYYSGEITGFYGDETRDAVLNFQLDHGVISSEDDLGAGHMGVNTRKTLDQVIEEYLEQKSKAEAHLLEKGRLLLDDYSDLNRNQETFSRDLYLGLTGSDVTRLQSELSDLGFLRRDTTGVYDEVTQHAVFKMQQKAGIVASVDSPGAGICGPQTRSYLNDLVGDRTTTLSYIAVEREARGVPTDVATSSGVFAVDLAPGERSAEVKALQVALRDLGYFAGDFVTDFYGDQTKAAVLRFQLAYAIVADEASGNAGVFDSITRAALNELI
jgi:peptidoglycan hydrolase-like protein with peptidoglycan-binding domain/3D (Asp-Asp-Asp) domain-containing protein